MAWRWGSCVLGREGHNLARESQHRRQMRVKWLTIPLRLPGWPFQESGPRWGPGLCKVDRVGPGRNPEVGVRGQDQASCRTFGEVVVRLAWVVGLVGLMILASLPLPCTLSSFEAYL